MAPTHIAREIAEAAGVTTARVYAVAKAHDIKLLRAPIGPRPQAIPRTVQTAILKEVRRRSGANADDAEMHKHMHDVMEQLNAWATVWADSAEGPEVES